MKQELSEYQQEVRDWMRKAQQSTPDVPTVPSDRIAALRYSLIEEELEELREAMGWDGESFKIDKFDMVEAYDALLDLMYVVVGGFVDFGLNMEPGWKEVCQSNNSKFAPGFTFREDGKLIKSPSYTPVNLGPILEKMF